ncbi:sigma-54 interaction domain-containing protein [Marinithermofilum abyssi]|uniref:sigma-54 interaction domain-containing protein n=1 Tax=Marinithermofilum abyssi TaxID=1571185 RepID=UPI00166DCD02|nr:sigma 54-interacting transcriptional regulator [Marinithermofilum abyssi]
MEGGGFLTKHHWDENEAILHSLQEDILVTDPSGTILKVSELTGSIYGLPSGELLGRTVYDLEREGIFHPCVTPLVVQKKGKVTLIQTTKNGKKLLITGIPVFDPEGELVRIVSYSHDVTELAEMQKYLDKMKDEMERVKSELEILRQQQVQVDGLIANSAKMKQVIGTALQVAEVDVNVLLLGESGVGKSSIAHWIHQKSPRHKGPFIEVNCGAIAESLFEAELFGYEAGSFTGASRKGKIGLVELADGGTLFLDEVGELTPAQQVKVLKLIQEKQFYRVGGTQARKVDFRLIAATNRNLEKAVAEGAFREDLYFRLNVVPVEVPPLRERKEDMIPLMRHFLSRFNEKYDRRRQLDEDVIHHLLIQEWKGNVRELVNLIERLVVTSSSEMITIDNLPSPYLRSSFRENGWQNQPLKAVLAQVEKEMLIQAKQRCRTTLEMAEVLGISQPSVVRKLKKYKIR